MDQLPVEGVVSIEEPLAGPAPLPVVQQHEGESQDHPALKQVKEYGEKAIKGDVVQLCVPPPHKSPGSAEQAEHQKYQALPSLCSRKIQDYAQEDQTNAVLRIVEGWKEAALQAQEQKALCRSISHGNCVIKQVKKEGGEQGEHKNPRRPEQGREIPLPDTANRARTDFIH